MFPGATAYRDESFDVTESTSETASTRDSSAIQFGIIGAPLDVSTTGRPGARFGPQRIRTISTSFDDYDHRTDQHFSSLGVYDYGDVRAWDDVPEYLDYLNGTVRSVVWEDAIPIVLGGEHTVTVAGVRAVEPEVIVCLDAHLDLRDDFDGNSLSHACVTRRTLETVDEAIIVGARTGSADEWERAEQHDVTVLPPESVDVDVIVDRLEGRTSYLSVDVDCLDPGFAPGTGTLEPFGLDPHTVCTIVRRLAPQVSGFDVVEVNDRDDGQTAALAGKLVREFVFAASA